MSLTGYYDIRAKNGDCIVKPWGILSHMVVFCFPPLHLKVTHMRELRSSLCSLLLITPLRPQEPSPLSFTKDTSTFIKVTSRLSFYQHTHSQQQASERLHIVWLSSRNDRVCLSTRILTAFQSHACIRRKASPIVYSPRLGYVLWTRRVIGVRCVV
jgi:hypothetical protein